MRRRDLVIAPLGEAALVLVVGMVGWASHKPLIFASLGPTAYELIEMPHRRSAQPYNVIVGHLIGVVAAYAALFLSRGWAVPSVSASGVPLARVWAGVIAALLTVLGTLLARATQPAALSTTLLISLGVMQRWQDAVWIMGAVLLMTAVGEPLRRWRLGAQGARKTAAE